MVLASTLLLVLACGGPASPTADQSSAAPSAGSVEPTSPPLEGRFDVGDRELYLSCTGDGTPTMILEAGEANTLDQLDPVRQAYAGDRRVCSYDRANNGRSDVAPLPRTADDVLGDLHALLVAAEVPGPYLLVGHSAGGLIVQAYAAVYPDDVVGVVALNAVPPWQPWSTLGFDEMTDAERRDETEYYAGTNGESLHYRDLSERIDRADVPAAIPFHVLISTNAQCGSPGDICERTYPAYEKIMKGLSRQWPQGRFSQAAAPHEIFITDLPAVRTAVDDVVSRAGVR